MELRVVTPEPLSAQTFEPFGWIPVEDTDPADGDQRLTYLWDDAHINVIGHRRDEVPEIEGGLQCEMLYRHDTHTQALMVLDHQAVIAVAESDVDFSDPEDVSKVKVFVLEQLQPFVLHRGTWHWGPFPSHAERVNLLNVQGLRYAEDNNRVDLAEPLKVPTP